MKRFQERRGQVDFTDANEAYNRQDMSTRPPPRRVETDPAVWQAESSVRHVQQEMPAPYASPGQGTPPQQRWRGPSEPAPPTGQLNQSDGEQSQRREWRNSAWGRQGGGLGVGGDS